MIVRIILCLFLLMLSLPAQAEEGSVDPDYTGPYYERESTTPKPLGEVITKPVCFYLINKTVHGVHGRIETNNFIRGDGIKTRWRENFSLKAEERVNFCTSGPFYDGRRVALVISTIIPIFSCHTTITEDIIIRSKRREDDRGYDVWAECK